MPLRPCRWPTCTNYVSEGFCPDHADKRPIIATREKYYDQVLRDRASKQFYDSAAWQRARAAKLRTTPVCERCQAAFAEHVHHSIPVKQATDAECLDQRLLVSLCPECHNTTEAEIRAGIAD